MKTMKSNRETGEFLYLVRRGTPGMGYESEYLTALNLDDAWFIVRDRRTVHSITFVNQSK